VGTEDVDFAARITEERSKPPRHSPERPLASGAVCLPVVRWHDQEEVMSVWRDVCLLKILEVVVVRRRAATFGLGDDAATWCQPIKGVWSCMCHETGLRRKNDLLVEPQICTQQRREVVLDRLALGAVHVDSSYVLVC
jgi:hypothetical protein